MENMAKFVTPKQYVIPEHLVPENENLCNFLILKEINANNKFKKIMFDIFKGEKISDSDVYMNSFPPSFLRPKYVIIDPYESYESLFGDIDPLRKINKKFCVVGSYKNIKFAITTTNYFEIEFSFPLDSVNLQSELVSMLTGLWSEKPVGYYDAECKTNPRKNLRSILWDLTSEPDDTRIKIAKNLIDIRQNVFTDDYEEYKIIKTGLCDGYKKSAYVQSQTVLDLGLER